MSAFVHLSRPCLHVRSHMLTSVIALFVTSCCHALAALSRSHSNYQERSRALPYPVWLKQLGLGQFWLLCFSVGVGHWSSIGSRCVGRARFYFVTDQGCRPCRNLAFKACHASSLVLEFRMRINESGALRWSIRGSLSLGAKCVTFLS